MKYLLLIFVLLMLSYCSGNCDSINLNFMSYDDVIEIVRAENLK